MSRSPLRALTSLAALLVLAVAAPASAAWQPFDEPVVPTGVPSGVDGADFGSGGRAAFGQTGSGGQPIVAERSGGQRAFTRHTLASGVASSVKTAIVPAGTIAVWADATGVHARLRELGAADYGVKQDLGGANGELALATTDDGTVLLAQRSGAQVKLWRRTAGAPLFEVLPDIGFPAGESQLDDVRLVATPGGGAALAVITRQTVITPGGGPGMDSTTTTERARVARYGAGGFGAQQQVGDAATATTLIGFLETADLTISDVHVTGGDVLVALREARTSMFTQSTTRSYVARTSTATQSPLQSVTATIGTVADVGPARFVRRGDALLAVWTFQPPASSVTPAAFELRVARAADGYATPVTRASAAAFQLGDAAGDRAILTRGSEIQIVRLAADGAIAETDTLPAGGMPTAFRLLSDRAGSLLALAGRMAAPAPRIDAYLHDPVAPTLDPVVPAAATAGQPARLTAKAADAEGATVTWALGDGRTVTGDAVDVAWPAAGARTVTVTATDPAGNATSAQRTIDVRAPAAAPTVAQRDRTAPRLSALKLTRTKLTRRARTARLTWRTSEPAAVTVAVERLSRGYKSGRRCVAKKPRRKGRAARCQLATKRSSKTQRLGVTTFTLDAKGLPRGRYRLSLTAVDATGNRTPAPATIAFSVTR